METVRNIQLIWDFKGVDSLKIAQHHEIHLKEYATKKDFTIIATGNQHINDLHAIAYITVNEPYMKIVRDELKPHRGQVAE